MQNKTQTQGNETMKVYDIVQIVGSNPSSSLPPNTRILVEFSYNHKIADERCLLFNEKRANIVGGIGHHFEVEEYDECSSNRANPRV